MESDRGARLRALPQVDRVAAALGGAPAPLLVRAARGAVELARADIMAGGDVPGFDTIVERAADLLSRERRSLLHPVVNATGVLIHTNLGRVPLGAAQLEAVAEIAGGYSNLEYDLEAGGRGSRYDHAGALLTLVTGAEAALVVNNNAAAVLLSLAALCGGKEVVISRGELIEIGGEFRIPEVLSLSGARLVEVGTTNRTHLADYERAIGGETAAILKVHPSNYRVVGFTKQVPARDLARLALGRKVYFIHDLGSGYLESGQGADWAANEPPVEHALADGADLVTFSGDKLLGGPQAGVIAGRAALVAKIARHPLLRAVRVDKMTLAALEATLETYLDGRLTELPLWRMALTPAEELEGRARALAERLDATTGLKAEAVPSGAVTGGGSLPGEQLASWAVALVHESRGASELERSLRMGDPPIVGRIEDDRVLLDLRTVPPEIDDPVADLVRAALSGFSS
ncbi:MAG: L-seryl-tRNA(Sec) selenium transferase [Actinomycetota bacterium]